MKARAWWPALGALAALTYLYGLGGQYIPKIGDEAIYLQIARVTARSGAPLPLRSEAGINDTKPPLLFWTAAAATGLARDWTPLRARLPVALYSLALAALCGAAALRLSGEREAAWVAALTFLCFHATFQHGRPLLTNVPEAFWLFLPFVLVLERPSTPWPILGLCVGVGLLYKSFADVVPVALALAWHRKKLGGPILMACAAVSLFLLWPLLDPRRDALVSDFFLRENLGKLGGGERAALAGHGYLWDAVFGPYHLGRIWAGPLVNAGLLAPVLAAAAWSGWKHRAGMASGERLLWKMLLAFLVFYSIPSQRQENYLIPAMPAAAALVGLHWARLPRAAAVASGAAAGAVCLAAPVLFIVAGGLVPFGAAAWLAALSGLALAAGSFAAPRLTHASVLATYLTISCALAPFDGPAGRYDQAALSQMAGRVVYVPTGWDHKPRTEYYRFALPGADVRGFDPDNAELRRDLLAAGKLVGSSLPLGAEPPTGCSAVGRRLALKSRLPGRDVLALLRGDLGRLVESEAILRCAPSRGV